MEKQWGRRRADSSLILLIISMFSGVRQNVSTIKQGHIVLGYL